MNPANGTYRDLVAFWKGLRGDRVRVREVACVGAPRTLLCVEAGDADAPAIALSAGVHGDEPAGPWALAQLVASHALDERYSYRIWPCMNPTGYDLRSRMSADGIDLNRTFGRGGQSPEARAVLTANRDRKFALSLDLHEDCDTTGFYCYEYGGGTIGREALRAVAEIGIPIDELGCLTPDHIEEAAQLGGLSYSLLLARNAARHVLTFETPSTAAWEVRVAAHVAAVGAAIRAV